MLALATARLYLNSLLWIRYWSFILDSNYWFSLLISALKWSTVYFMASSAADWWLFSVSNSNFTFSRHFLSTLALILRIWAGRSISHLTYKSWCLVSSCNSLDSKLCVSSSSCTLRLSKHYAAISASSCFSLNKLSCSFIVVSICEIRVSNLLSLLSVTWSSNWRGRLVCSI